MMKIKFTITGDIEATSVEEAKTILCNRLSICDYEVDSIFEHTENFEKCIVITDSGKRCVLDKRFGDYCGIHHNMKLKLKGKTLNTSIS